MRTTQDPKNKNIKLRLNEEMKSYINKQASISNMSISEYIRGLIKLDMNNKN